MIKRSMIVLFALALGLVSPVMAQDGSPYDGVWVNPVDGIIVEMENGSGTMYTIIGCYPRFEATLENDVITISDETSTTAVDVAIEDGALVAYYQGVAVMTFNAAESLESVCEPVEEVAADLSAWVERPVPTEFPAIERVPNPDDYVLAKVTEIPPYNPLISGSGQIDWRAADLSEMDLSDALDTLLHADFDDHTIWPEQMPPEFDWQRIMEMGANPGLGIRDLHARGITGQGVSIAIIDHALLVDHQEYASQLRLYEETPEIAAVAGGADADMHGAAVASIAVGRTTGVAPDADLYYIATSHGTISGEPDFVFTAAAIRRVLKINEQLPDDRKIRVISLSVGWESFNPGFDEVTAAAAEAKAAGIMVVSSSLSKVHGFRFHGLGRDPLSDPDRADSYSPGDWWDEDYYMGLSMQDENTLMFPMDARTTASPTGPDQYVFYAEGGWSWTIPYIAGVYALAVQVDPDLTPDEFWATALATADTIELTHEGEVMPFGPIANPVALIDALQSE